MIVYDTETTGLPKAECAPLKSQPYIVEYAGIKLDDNTLEEVDRMEFICRPPIEMSPEVINIHRITNEMAAKEKPFSANYRKLVQFHLGEKYLVAHNVAFDRKMMMFELQRMQKEYMFPWPSEHLCTVEKSKFIEGKRMKLGLLHKHVTGEEHEEAHRAMPDVEALVKCVQWLHKEGKLLKNA